MKLEKYCSTNVENRPCGSFSTLLEAYYYEVFV